MTRVFISYAHESQEHADRVRQLADRLRRDGIDAMYDGYSRSPAEGWSAWNRAQLESSDFVLVVASPEYRRRFDDPEISNLGPGRRWEARSIRAALYDKDSSPRFLPILFDGASTDDIPKALRTRQFVRIPSDLEILERNLLGLGSEHSPQITRGPHEPPFEHTVQQFFGAAGRRIDTSKEASPIDLLVPEPVAISSGVESHTAAIDRLATALPEGMFGYLVHQEKLSTYDEERLNTLRLQGRSIVPISSRLLLSCLRDGTAATTIHELARLGTGGDNLFYARNAIIERRFLFGRSELLTAVGSKLARGENILLTGARKVGKSSFLNILRQDLIEHPVTSIDLQQFDRTNSRWVDELFEEILAAYDRWGRLLHPDWPEDQHTSHEGADFSQRFSERRRWHSKRRRNGPPTPMVVILDELERIIPRPGDAAATEAFIRATGALRALAQSRTRGLSIIAADLRPTANRVNLIGDHQTNPFFEFFHECPLPLLSRERNDEMLRTLSHMHGIEEIGTEMVEETFRLSGGHPFLARTIAGAAFEFRASPKELTRIDLDAGLEELDDDARLDSFFEECFWNPLTSAERDELVAIALGHPSTNDRRTRASLKQQGLVIRGTIPIAAFSDWVERIATPPKRHAAS